jgi:hypothetical protein
MFQPWGDSLSDETAEHMVKVLQTREGIRKFGEEMANALAEAALASQQALGHSPDYAVDQWINVIGQRAHELIREKQAQKAINPPTVEGK